jgi:hypothetical protein
VQCVLPAHFKVAADLKDTQVFSVLNIGNKSIYSLQLNEWTSFRMYITLQLQVQLQVLQLRLANWFDEKPSKTHKCYLEGSQGPMFVYRPLDAMLTPY